jgi:hypothetical protein
VPREHVEVDARLARVAVRRLAREGDHPGEVSGRKKDKTDRERERKREREKEKKRMG